MLYSKRQTTASERKVPKYPYLLRDLDIVRSNQVWSIDITYITMKHGFMYQFAIIDLYLRYVADWNLSNTMTSEWCVSVLKDAMLRYEKPEIDRQQRSG